MKIVITCGHETSGYQAVHAILAASGVAKAALGPSGITFSNFQQEFLSARENAPKNQGNNSATRPGPSWATLGEELIRPNLGAHQWGWAAADTDRLLDFWAGFAASRFIMVYTSPWAAAWTLLRLGPDRPPLNTLLDSWLACNTRLLLFYHRNPANCVLVESTAALTEPTALTAICSEKLDLRLFPAAPAGAVVPDEAAATHDVSSLFTYRGDVLSLFNELQASADMAGNGSDTGPITAWTAYAAEFDRARMAEAELKRLRRKLAREIEAHGERLQAADATIARQGALLAKHGEAIAENELLVSQLRHVQVELEHCLLACKTGSSVAREADVLAECWLAHHPTVIEIDLRQKFAGHNWYYSEHDGRWAGPDLRSTILVGALRSGPYLAGLDIVGAMDAAILANTTCAINSVPVDCQVLHQAGVTRLGFGFHIDYIPKSRILEFAFTFPFVVSPASREDGNDDQRKLAIRARIFRIAQYEIS